MRGRVILVFRDSWLAWVTNVPYLHTPVVKSHLSVLRVLIRPSHHSTRHSTHRSSHSAHCHPHAVFRSALTVPVRLGLSSTLTPPAVKKKWAVALERDSSPLLSSTCDFVDRVNLHGLVHGGRCHAGRHLHEQIKNVHVPLLPEQ